MKSNPACTLMLGLCLLFISLQVAAESYEERVARIEARATAGKLARSHCAASALAQVNSLWKLPTDVVTLLEGNMLGTDVDVIADRGEEFNTGDVGGGPHRRFAIAGMSPDCVLVSVEHGGRGYYIELQAFQRQGASWRGGPAGVAHQIPQSLTELEAALYPNEESTR